MLFITEKRNNNLFNFGEGRVCRIGSHEKYVEDHLIPSGDFLLYRGQVLIIDNEDFSKLSDLKKRTGSLVDANNLDILFQEFGRSLRYLDFLFKKFDRPQQSRHPLPGFGRC
jgi:hypothetical protein